jgi:hypothetical protein
LSSSSSSSSLSLLLHHSCIFSKHKKMHYQGDNVGNMLDQRTHSECPNFVNLKKKGAEELRDLLQKVNTFSPTFFPSPFFMFFLSNIFRWKKKKKKKFIQLNLLRLYIMSLQKCVIACGGKKSNKKALEKQKEALIAHEGSSSSYLSELNKELQWLAKVNVAKADKAK